MAYHYVRMVSFVSLKFKAWKFLRTPFSRSDFAGCVETEKRKSRTPKLALAFRFLIHRPGLLKHKILAFGRKPTNLCSKRRINQMCMRVFHLLYSSQYQKIILMDSWESPHVRKAQLLFNGCKKFGGKFCFPLWFLLGSLKEYLQHLEHTFFPHPHTKCWDDNSKNQPALNIMCQAMCLTTSKDDRFFFYLQLWDINLHVTFYTFKAYSIIL